MKYEYRMDMFAEQQSNPLTTNNIRIWDTHTVITKFVDATDLRPERVVARIGPFKAIWEWEPGLSEQENHQEAACKVLNSTGYSGQFNLKGGRLPMKDTYSFVVVAAHGKMKQKSHRDKDDHKANCRGA